MDKVLFMIKIKFYKFKVVCDATSFKILNNITLHIPLDTNNKILTVNKIISIRSF